MRARLVLAVAMPMALADCGDLVSQPIGAPRQDASASNPPLDATFAEAGIDAMPNTQPPTSTVFCEGHGPVPLPGQTACLGDLAAVFRFAACACQSFDVSGTFSTDSFDSTSDAGPAITADLASIGSNGPITTNSQASIGGSLWSGGAGDDGGASVTLNGGRMAGGSIASDVHCAADMEVRGKYLVLGNLMANGNVTVDPGGVLAVLGTVTVPSGDTASNVQGTVVNGPVAVVPPCSCSNPIDVGAIVTVFANANEDSAVGLSPEAPLSGTVSLPCGLYYATGIAGDTVDLRINGRVALFLNGDVSVTHDLRIELADDAELDMFVSRSVSIMGTFEIGDPNRPAQTRLYIGGPTLGLAGNASPLGANIYAPNAVLEISSNFEMWGSILAGRMQFSGDFQIHYDTSVLQVAAATGCEPSGGSCHSCSDCPSTAPACKAGTCAACTSNADCCAPLTCFGGSCGLKVP
jgi:hypothetical protein